MHHGITEKGLGWLYYSNTGTDSGWLNYSNTGRGQGWLHHGNTGRRSRLVASWEYWEEVEAGCITGILRGVWVGYISVILVRIWAGYITVILGGVGAGCIILGEVGAEVSQRELYWYGVGGG